MLPCPTAPVGMDMTCSVLPFESTLTPEFQKVSFGPPLSIPEAHILVKLMYFKEGVLQLFRPTQKPIMWGSGIYILLNYFPD